MRTALALLAASAGLCTACAADHSPTDDGMMSDDGGPDVRPSFEVSLSGGATADAAVAEILKARRAQMIAACSALPAGAIRVANPLAPGYTDVSCASILTDEAVEDAEPTPPTSEGIGEARQKWSPLGLACELAFLGFGAGISSACSSHGGDPSTCGYSAPIGAGVIGIAVCSLL